jgi:hypothetical protein
MGALLQNSAHLLMLAFVFYLHGIIFYKVLGTGLLITLSLVVLDFLLAVQIDMTRLALLAGLSAP